MSFPARKARSIHPRERNLRIALRSCVIHDDPVTTVAALAALPATSAAKVGCIQKIHATIATMTQSFMCLLIVVNVLNYGVGVVLFPVVPGFAHDPPLGAAGGAGGFAGGVLVGFAAVVLFVLLFGVLLAGVLLFAPVPFVHGCGAGLAGGFCVCPHIVDGFDVAVGLVEGGVALLLEGFVVVLFVVLLVGGGVVVLFAPDVLFHDCGAGAGLLVGLLLLGC